jgi:transcriptional regulator with XRE-family HTH domain
VIEILRFTDLPNAIKLAREAGLSNRQIVRLLTGSTPYAEARQTAAKAAPLLGITVAEFMKLRKND